jgi:hypothetical protein
LDWRPACWPTASRSFLSGAGRALTTGYGRSSGLDVLIGIAVALLLTWLILIAAFS